MAKSGDGGMLSKLKCMIRRWHSSSRIARSGRGGVSSSTSREEDAWQPAAAAASFQGDEVPPGLHAVYVGKSRRRYLVGSDLVEHPLFRVLVERTGGGADTAVGCEVVLFEHLLWTLENADPQSESLDELVDFYSCC